MVLLSWAPGSYSGGNFSAFDLIGRKAREIVSDATGDARLLILLPMQTRQISHDHTVILRLHFVTKLPSSLTQLIIVVSLRKAPSHFALVINQSENWTSTHEDVNMTPQARVKLLRNLSHEHRRLHKFWVRVFSAGKKKLLRQVDNRDYCCSLSTDNWFSSLQTVFCTQSRLGYIERVRLESLSTDVFEPRTSTGSRDFSSSMHITPFSLKKSRCKC